MLIEVSARGSSLAEAREWVTDADALLCADPKALVYPLKWVHHKLGLTSDSLPIDHPHVFPWIEDGVHKEFGR